MSYYDIIVDYALGSHGLLTTAQARELGIPGVELAKLAHRGRLVHEGYGVYRLTHYVSGAHDGYALAVALVGPGSILYGESVLALTEVAPTNPSRIWVATPHRVRRTLPPDLAVVRTRSAGPASAYDGIPCQRLDAAILSCKGSVMTKRLEDAAKEARRKGFLTHRETNELLSRLAPGGQDG